MNPKAGPMLLAALLAALAGGLLGCTVAGVALAPSAGVTRYDGELDSWAGTLALTAYPAPEVVAPATFQPAPARAPSPTGSYSPPTTGMPYDWPANGPAHNAGSLAPSPSEPPGQHVEHREPVTIETPWGPFAVYGLGGALLATVAAIAAMLRIQKKSAD